MGGIYQRDLFLSKLLGHALFQLGSFFSETRLDPLLDRVRIKRVLHTFPDSFLHSPSGLLLDDLLF
jgi:hypothetical protein